MINVFVVRFTFLFQCYFRFSPRLLTNYHMHTVNVSALFFFLLFNQKSSRMKYQNARCDISHCFNQTVYTVSIVYWRSEESDQLRVKKFGEQVMKRDYATAYDEIRLNVAKVRSATLLNINSLHVVPSLLSIPHVCVSFSLNFIVFFYQTNEQTEDFSSDSVDFFSLSFNGWHLFAVIEIFSPYHCVNNGIFVPLSVSACWTKEKTICQFNKSIILNSIVLQQAFRYLRTVTARWGTRANMPITHAMLLQLVFKQKRERMLVGEANISFLFFNQIEKIRVFCATLSTQWLLAISPPNTHDLYSMVDDTTKCEPTW